MKLSSSIKKIAVFRALQLGDMLCAIPAIKALRKAYPNAQITLVSLPWAKSLVTRFPEYFNDFIHFPGYPGLPEQQFNSRDFLQFLSAVQQQNYDLVLQMQGNGNLVNPMVELFGGATTAGFFYKDFYHPHNGLFLQYPEDCHEIERHLKLMAYLGLDAQDKHLEFPLYENDYNELNALDLQLENQNYVCVHPGSRGTWRQWPTTNFAALADYCADKGLKIVLTGTREEMDIVQQVSSQMNHEAIIIAGKTSVGSVAVLIKNAFALISNCTGVSHIAAALKTPSIVISMDGEPKRWGPLNHHLHRTIDWTMTNDCNIVLNELKDIFSLYRKVDQFRNDERIVITAS